MPPANELYVSLHNIYAANWESEEKDRVVAWGGFLQAYQQRCQHLLPHIDSSNWDDLLEGFIVCCQDGKLGAAATQLLRDLVSLGVPLKLRGKVWQFLLGAQHRKRSSPGHYSDLIQQSLGHLQNTKTISTQEFTAFHSCTSPRSHRVNGDSGVESPTRASECGSDGGHSPTHTLLDALIQIEKDVPRTFCDEQLLHCAGPCALRRVLAAYALHNPTVAYCQGMNFIAGLLLLFMDEESAFWCLDAMVQQVLAGYHMMGSDTPTVDMAVFQRLLRDHQPVLAQHFESNDVDITQHTLQWLFGAFMHILPMEVCLRVWDVAMLELSAAPMFRATLALLQMFQAPLLSSTDLSDMHTMLRTAPTLSFDQATLMDIASIDYQHLTPTHLAAVRAAVAADNTAAESARPPKFRVRLRAELLSYFQRGNDTTEQGKGASPEPRKGGKRTPRRTGSWGILARRGTPNESDEPSDSEPGTSQIEPHAHPGQSHEPSNHNSHPHGDQAAPLQSTEHRPTPGTSPSEGFVCLDRFLQEQPSAADRRQPPGTAPQAVPGVAAGGGPRDGTSVLHVGPLSCSEGSTEYTEESWELLPGGPATPAETHSMGLLPAAEPHELSVVEQVGRRTPEPGLDDGDGWHDAPHWESLAHFSALAQSNLRARMCPCSDGLGGSSNIISISEGPRAPVFMALYEVAVDPAAAAAATVGASGTPSGVATLPPRLLANVLDSLGRLRSNWTAVVPEVAASADGCLKLAPDFPLLQYIVDHHRWLAVAASGGCQLTSGELCMMTVDLLLTLGLLAPVCAKAVLDGVTRLASPYMPHLGELRGALLQAQLPADLGGLDARLRLLEGSLHCAQLAGLAADQVAQRCSKFLGDCEDQVWVRLTQLLASYRGPPGELEPSLPYPMSLIIVASIPWNHRGVKDGNCLLTTTGRIDEVREAVARGATHVRVFGISYPILQAKRHAGSATNTWLQLEFWDRGETPFDRIDLVIYRY